jgi:hypothetical protein
MVASSLYECREVNTKNLDSSLIASHFQNIELEYLTPCRLGGKHVVTGLVEEVVR